MTDVEISVRGSHSATVPPERATVYATVSADGPAPEPVVAVVASALAEVTASLESRHDPADGPVTRYSVEQVRKDAHRPYNQDGRQLPVVHTASASLTATFVDFDDLADWVDRTARLDGVGINHLEWTLTDSTRHAVERETRQEAVRDAVRRAQDYADALDLGPVTVRSISDAGLSGPGEPRVLMARMMADPAGGRPQISLRPDDVPIEAVVEARFSVFDRR
jgi:uncharacterized protein YggE